jgi:hypothetical protein
LRTSPSSEPPGGDEPRTERLHPTGGGRPPRGRLTGALRALDGEQRLAALAALALAGGLFLPWWRDPLIGVTSVAVRRLTFVEVAIFLVAAAVLALLLGRAERRTFNLPLSDGTLIAAAGAWAFVLVAYRMLDPPSRTAERAGDGVTVTRDYGLRWGALVALAAAATLAAAGVRERRRRHRGEPESVAADADATATLEASR